LFTGALGPDKDRVFIVATGGLQDLPSDLYGIRFRDVDENESGEELKQRLKEIGYEIANIIGDYDESDIRPLRGLKRPLLTKEELFRREAPRSLGGQLNEDASLVFVNTPEPVETSRIFAKRVLANVLKDIKYQYVFEFNESFKVMASKLIKSIIESLKQMPESSASFLENLDCL
jgi:hypothetical protein